MCVSRCRIYYSTRCSDSCLVEAIVFVDRFIEATSFCVVSQNMHKLLLTAIMVASKFSDDTFCSNAFFAETGLVTLEEMNRMEEVFLSAIHFSLYVDERVFLQYYSSLYRHIHFSHCPTCCSSSA